MTDRINLQLCACHNIIFSASKRFQCLSPSQAESTDVTNLPICQRNKSEDKDSTMIEIWQMISATGRPWKSRILKLDEIPWNRFRSEVGWVSLALHSTFDKNCLKHLNDIEKLQICAVSPTNAPMSRIDLVGMLACQEAAAKVNYLRRTLRLGQRTFSAKAGETKLRCVWSSLPFFCIGQKFTKFGIVGWQPSTKSLICRWWALDLCPSTPTRFEHPSGKPLWNNMMLRESVECNWAPHKKKQSRFMKRKNKVVSFSNSHVVLIEVCMLHATSLAEGINPFCF